MKTLLLFLLLVSLHGFAECPDSTTTVIVSDTTIKSPVVRVKEKGLYNTKAGRIVGIGVGVLLAIGVILTVASYSRK